MLVSPALRLGNESSTCVDLTWRGISGSPHGERHAADARQQGLTLVHFFSST
jgi:hypothetical protein